MASVLDFPPAFLAPAQARSLMPELVSFRYITQHNPPTCTSVVPSVIQKFLRDHVAYLFFGSLPLYNSLDPLTLLSTQQIVDIDDIPRFDVDLTSFLTKHFFPITTHDEVLEHCKQKVNVKTIRLNS